jgi:tRNA pseudouridine38-40 synthase
VNIKLTLEYDGSNFHGWQIQPNGRSIQGVLEEAVSTLFGTPTRVTGSGRTDAGVHALGQVANFFGEGEFDPHRLLRGLNALTPRDITIKEVDIAPDSFDARRDGRSRIYKYYIFNRSTSSPFYLNRAWHVHESLNVDAMGEAIGSLLGEHDFSSFRGAGCEAAHPIRRVYDNSLERRGDLLIYTIEATAFLRHMVRNIAGTLVEVGRGVRTPQSFKEVLAARNRTKAGPTAPPHGLFLVKVNY